MGSKGSKLAAGAKTVVASNAVKEKTVSEVSKASSETVAAIQRRSARPPVEEELYFDDEMLKEMSQISLVKTPANNMMLNERSLSENTAVIRFHQERRTDQFKKENNRLDVPGRLTEEQLHELLLSYR